MRPCWDNFCGTHKTSDIIRLCSFQIRTMPVQMGLPSRCFRRLREFPRAEQIIRFKIGTCDCTGRMLLVVMPGAPSIVGESISTYGNSTTWRWNDAWMTKKLDLLFDWTLCKVRTWWMQHAQHAGEVRSVRQRPANELVCSIGPSYKAGSALAEIHRCVTRAV